jgi:hypothetical protein
VHRHDLHDALQLTQRTAVLLHLTGVPVPAGLHLHLLTLLQVGEGLA